MPKRKNRRTRSYGEPQKDARGQIVRSLNPEKSGFVEKGHLEGNDAIPHIPRYVLTELQRAIKSGEAEIDIKPDGEDGWVVDVSV